MQQKKTQDEALARSVSASFSPRALSWALGRHPCTRHDLTTPRAHPSGLSHLGKTDPVPSDATRGQKESAGQPHVRLTSNRTCHPAHPTCFNAPIARIVVSDQQRPAPTARPPRRSSQLTLAPATRSTSAKSPSWRARISRTTASAFVRRSSDPRGRERGRGRGCNCSVGLRFNWGCGEMGSGEHGADD